MTRGCLTFALLLLPVALAAAAPPDGKPNVLILYVDDLGYADLGVTGGRDVPTPNIDSLAANGVRCTTSYVSGCVCSPSRAGLMTGRYQQRFGFDANAEGMRKDGEQTRALELSQATFADRFKALGYATGLVGKWHLGSETPEYLPNARGFDEFYGLLPSGIGAGKAGNPVPMYRNGAEAEQPADHTVAFGKEAEAFIDRHKDKPWMLYCAFTAVHGPFTAPEEYVQRFKHIPQLGHTVAPPVMQIDWLPTALAAAGTTVDHAWKLDGVNLLPLLEGKADTIADRPLFWRFGVQSAVRQGNWKLVKADIDMQPALYDLAADPGEKCDLAKDNPGKSAELQALWDGWNAANEPPRWIDNRWNGIQHKKANKQGKPAKKAAAS